MRFALTTSDNPFDPFDEFASWFSFDESQGYHTSGLMARISDSSSELSEADEDRLVKDAVDRVLLINPNANLKRVSKEN